MKLFKGTNWFAVALTLALTMMFTMPYYAEAKSRGGFSSSRSFKSSSSSIGAVGYRQQAISPPPHRSIGSAPAHEFGEPLHPWVGPRGDVPGARA